MARDLPPDVHIQFDMMVTLANTRATTRRSFLRGLLETELARRLVSRVAKSEQTRAIIYNQRIGKTQIVMRSGTVTYADIGRADLPAITHMNRPEFVREYKQLPCAVLETVDTAHFLGFVAARSVLIASWGIGRLSEARGSTAEWTLWSCLRREAFARVLIFLFVPSA